MSNITGKIQNLKQYIPKSIKPTSTDASSITPDSNLNSSSSADTSSNPNPGSKPDSNPNAGSDQNSSNTYSEIHDDIAKQFEEQRVWIQDLLEENSKIKQKPSSEEIVSEFMYEKAKSKRKSFPPKDIGEPGSFYYIPDDMSDKTANEYCTYVGGYIQK